MRYKLVVLFMFIISICGTSVGQVQTQQPTIAPSVIRVDLAADFKPDEPTDLPAVKILDVKLGPAASWLWRQKQAKDGAKQIIRLTGRNRAFLPVNEPEGNYTL